jgi:hypothetical protein
MHAKCILNCKLIVYVNRMMLSPSVKCYSCCFINNMKIDNFTITIRQLAVKFMRFFFLSRSCRFFLYHSRLHVCDEFMMQFQSHILRWEIKCQAEFDGNFMFLCRQCCDWWLAKSEMKTELSLGNWEMWFFSSCC